MAEIQVTPAQLSSASSALAGVSLVNGAQVGSLQASELYLGSWPQSAMCAGALFDMTQSWSIALEQLQMAVSECAAALEHASQTYTSSNTDVTVALRAT